jgi:hypothetical protein
MVDPKSSEPIHYAGFVHMVGKKKNVVREFGKVDDSTQKLRSVLNMPPPTFEMLNEEGMTVATKRYRFLAWRCAAADDRRLKYFANKALKSPTAKLVPAPSWCMKWCEIQGISRGPATVVSDPVAWEDLAHEMTRQFSPAYLLSEAYRLSIAMKAVFNDAIRGLVHFGLEQYPVVSRKDWDYNFPEVRRSPTDVTPYVALTYSRPASSLTSAALHDPSMGDPLRYRLPPQLSRRPRSYLRRVDGCQEEADRGT